MQLTMPTMKIGYKNFEIFYNFEVENKKAYDHSSQFSEGYNLPTDS